MLLPRHSSYGSSYLPPTAPSHTMPTLVLLPPPQMDLFHKSNLVKDLNLAIDMGLHPIRGIIPGIDIDNDLIPKDSSCRTCVEKSANWIIQRTWERFDEFCKKAICPFIRAMCLKAHEHPKVATGFLMAEVKPYEMGYAYCLGKGVCHPKTDEDVLNNPPIKIGNKDDAASTATIFHPAVSAALHEIANGAETWAQLAKDEFKAQVDKFMGEECPPPITDFISSLKDKAECTCRCMHCVRAAGRMVMRLKIESVTVWCLTHKDSPVAQNMCKCAYQHPEVAFGYLLAKMQPWKFGLGYCYGHGECGSECPHPGPPGPPRLDGTPASEDTEEKQEKSWNRKSNKEENDESLEKKFKKDTESLKHESEYEKKLEEQLKETAEGTKAKLTKNALRKRIETESGDDSQIKNTNKNKEETKSENGERSNKRYHFNEAAAAINNPEIEKIEKIQRISQ
eukprot:GHVU01113262.1.p1 GENE.GHVU01113262.1~~GHVU01113262.1.p1  ORF type:complete len:452 (+),score=107.05 GHVU01113262.1:2399-3754(+)